MSTILYGNLTVEIIDGLGTRIDHAKGGPAAPDLLTLRPSEIPRAPLMRGRARESADALSAIANARPFEFHASCGYGKTTLLSWIAAVAAGRGIAPRGLYLRMDSDRVDDLLHQLVTRLFSSTRAVKLTPDQCAQILGPVNAVVALDDVAASPEQVSYVLDVLRGGRVVIGAARPVLDRRGTSQDLAGLQDEAALALLADELARPLGDEERPAARRLVAAVAGQPLHLRQAAALVRAGRHSLASLAGQAEHDPEVLDRLSVMALAEGPRRALTVLALVAGALITPNVAAVIGGVADLGDSLDWLHRGGLAERRDDRFGLPACKTAGYRELLLKDLGLAASAHPLCIFLAAARDPSVIDSQSAADAALAMIELGAERREWTTVAELARAADAALFVAGRWQAWRHALGRGLDAAKTIGDDAAAAFFSHQLGSLAVCRDERQDADRLLRDALTLREQLGDLAGAALTRHNLRMLELPKPPKPPRPDRPGLLARGSQLAKLAAAIGGLVLVGGGIAFGVGHGSGPPTVKTTASASVVAHTSAAATSSSASATAAAQSSPSDPSSSSASATAARTPTSGAGSASTSSARVLVPNVIGMGQTPATTDLENQGLTVTVQTTSDCGTTSYGDVVTQDPAGGAPAGSGTAVNIGVCAVVTVADVFDDTQGAATATLENQGLNVSPAAATPDCGLVPYGDVVSQDPEGGSPVREASIVIIQACDALPNEVGTSESDASASLQSLGLTVDPTDVTVDPATVKVAPTDAGCTAPELGDVVSQAPGAGSAAPAGSTVTLTICTQANSKQ
jgi:beta-lactam-binding protein with PASTA domain